MSLRFAQALIRAGAHERTTIIDRRSEFACAHERSLFRNKVSYE